MEKTIIGIALMVLGVFFFAGNECIAAGAYTFYRKLYTEKNLKIMFKAAGAVLIFGGLVLMFTQ